MMTMIRKTQKGSQCRQSVKADAGEWLRKCLLLLLAAAFFLSVLYLADRIPVPRLKKDSGGSSEEMSQIPEKRSKKKRTKDIVIGTAVAILMLAVVGCGIFMALQKNGGKSAKESVGMEGRIEAPQEEGGENEKRWSVASDVPLLIPEDEEKQAEAVSADSVSEDTVIEEESTLSLDDFVMPARPAIAGDIVFVGDSRFAGMSQVVPYDDLYIAKVSEGYDWFRDSAIPEIDRVAVPGTKLVINMGVNDLENSARYSALINDCMERWSAAGIEVYYLSVNPVIDGKSYVTNEKIASFNSFMRQTLDARVHWIDSFTVLLEGGILSVDGVHYREETTRWIYEFCTAEILQHHLPEPLPVPPEGELFPVDGEELPGGEVPLQDGVLPPGGELLPTDMGLPSGGELPPMNSVLPQSGETLLPEEGMLLQDGVQTEVPASEEIPAEQTVEPVLSVPAQ